MGVVDGGVLSKCKSSKKASTDHGVAGSRGPAKQCVKGNMFGACRVSAKNLEMNVLMLLLAHGAHI